MLLKSDPKFVVDAGSDTGPPIVFSVTPPYWCRYRMRPWKSQDRERP